MNRAFRILHSALIILLGLYTALVVITRSLRPPRQKWRVGVYTNKGGHYYRWLHATTDAEMWHEMMPVWTKFGRWSKHTGDPDTRTLQVDDRYDYDEVLGYFQCVQHVSRNWRDK